MLQRILASFALFGLLAACVPVDARPLVDVSVVDRDTGEWLPRHPHRGDIWVAGTPGHRYSVRLANTTGERVLVVLSVDGVNAITGQTAHPGQAGYVLAPWQSTEISGWRKSMDDVAQFVFTDLQDSYAARTGRARNVGVIGVAVFREARYPAGPRYSPPPITRPHAEKRRSEVGAANEAMADSAARQQSIGTGHGQREWAPTTHTGFQRASRQPEQVSELRYDERRRLVAMGVLPRHDRPYWREAPPRAFPDGLVADPPGYR
jgi:hypothetical protein